MTTETQDPETTQIVNAAAERLFPGVREGYTLMLRTCNAEMQAYGGFTWPRSGDVEAPDWSPEAECGHGLHGLLRGCGRGGLLSWESDAVWMAVEVCTADVVDLGDKVKAPRGRVLFAGDRAGALALMLELGHLDAGHVGGTSTSGERGTSTSGERGTSTSGERGTSTSGYGGTSTSGDYGTSTSGDYGTSTSGDYGTSTSGDCGTSTSGYCGTSTSGERGTSTSGYGGTSISGDYGTSISGDYGTSISGEGGSIEIKWWDPKAQRYRRTVGYVGEDGIEAGVKYQLDTEGKFVRVEASA